MARFVGAFSLSWDARQLFSSLRSILLVLLGVQSAIVFAQGPQAESGDHEQVAAYWTTEPGWRTELQLRNSLASEDLTVTPALRSADGKETALPAVVNFTIPCVKSNAHHVFRRWDDQ